MLEVEELFMVKKVWILHFFLNRNLSVKYPGEGGNYSTKIMLKKLKSYFPIVPKDLNTCKFNHTITKLNQ